MEFYDILRKKFNGVDLREVAGRLGYQDREKGARRIRRLLDDHNLGIGGSGFDFKYSNRELLLALCELTGIDRGVCVETIEIVRSEMLCEERRFKPYVFVDTGFKRQGQSVMTLGFASHLRHIQIDDETGRLPLREQLPLVKEMVRAHYRQVHDPRFPAGTLSIWGRIIRYIYHYNELVVLELDPRGRVVGSLPPEARDPGE